MCEKQLLAAILNSLEASSWRWTMQIYFY